MPIGGQKLVSFLLVKQGLCSRYDLFCRSLITQVLSD